MAEEEQEVEEFVPPEPLAPALLGGTFGTPALKLGQSGNGFSFELNPDDMSFTLTHQASFVSTSTESFAGAFASSL